MRPIPISEYVSLGLQLKGVAYGDSYPLGLCSFIIVLSNGKDGPGQQATKTTLVYLCCVNLPSDHLARLADSYLFKLFSVIWGQDFKEIRGW